MVTATRSMLSGSSSAMYSSINHRGTKTAVASHIRTYHWPPLQLNFWIFVMLLASTGIMGVFASFIQVQRQLRLSIPWYFPYYVTVSALVIVFILAMFYLITQRRLLPAIVIIGAFVLFVLWLVGLVVISIQLFGPEDPVQSICDMQVFSQSPKGATTAVLAWLEQKTICQSWQFVFAMGLIGSIFLFWMMIMAYQVFARS